MAKELIISKYEDNEKNRRWNAIFQSIEHSSDKQERTLKLSTRISHSWQNADKNRYRNVSVYDCSRVVLHNTPESQSDYINASPLALPAAKRNYILTQGPLPSTCGDFWQMVWEQGCTLIVMLNKVVEKNYVKCHEYFTNSERPQHTFGGFEVRLKSEEHSEHFIMRTLELKPAEDQPINSTQPQSDQNIRTILHFQFTSWPDFGVPHCSRVFLDFLERVRATGRLEQPEPVVVHCSAGIGRSGAFVVVDSALSMIEQSVSDVDVEELVVRMRRHRMGLIQTPQQLQFCWKSIADALRLQRNDMDTNKEDRDIDEYKNEDKIPDKNEDNYKGNHIEEPEANRKPTIDPRPTCILATSATPRPEGAPPQLERSAANQMTSGQHAKSLSDIQATIRKRSSGEHGDNDEEAKYARRRERIEDMRTKLRRSEQTRRSPLGLGLGLGVRHVAYACVAVLSAVTAIYVYRLSSSS